MTTAVSCKHHITFPFQAHGAMGWRVGYIAYPDHDGSNFLGLQLVKAREARLPQRASVATFWRQSGLFWCCNKSQLSYRKTLTDRARYSSSINNVSQQMVTLFALSAACASAQVQDTIPIHAAHMSQQVALRALRAGPEWLTNRINDLRPNRCAALRPLQAWLALMYRVGWFVCHATMEV